MRNDRRQSHEMRTIFLGPGFTKYAEGSCFVKFGDTHILCTATVEEKVPPFLRNSKSGWVTAEYGMLPRSTKERMDREASRGKQSGRTQEIQRLIGRSLRSVVDLKALGERQIKIDCDVLQADGGTRKASITGAYVALHQALQKMVESKKIQNLPIKDQVAAISCGIYKGEAIIDLNYEEDSQAEVDANFIINGSSKLIEIQACAEGQAFSDKDLKKMLELAHNGVKQLIEMQQKALNIS